MASRPAAKRAAPAGGSLVTLVLPALILTGCPAAPVERPYPAPSAVELLARLDTQLERARTLRSEAKVDYLAEKGERVKVKMTFVVRAPAALRIEAESPLGGSVASLASDGEQFQLMDVRGNRFLAGGASPCNIARLLRVGLRPADVVAVVAGGVPRPFEVPSSSPPEVGWERGDGGRDVLTLRSAGGDTEIIRFAPREQGGDAISAELRGADGTTVWRVEHRDFSDAGGIRLPQRTDIEQPAREADARIRWKSREPGATVPDAVFQLAAPAGVPVENVACDEPAAPQPGK